MNQIKIALVGQMRSGKDTVADYLTSKYSYYRFAFGDALKMYAHQIFPDVPVEPKPRELYQFMNVMREFDKDVWIRHVTEDVQTVEEFYPNAGIVITDVRQENEYDWAKQNGFHITRVVSDLKYRIDRMSEIGEIVGDKMLKHSTESSVDELKEDYVLYNNGSIEDLKSNIDEMIERIKKGEIENV